MAFSSPFLHPPLTSHPTVVCPRLQMLLDGDFLLGAHDLCVTKSTGDLHSKAMDTWNTPASLAGRLLTAFWALSFFSYPYFNILPQDSFLCSFILFIYLFLNILLSLGDPLYALWFQLPSVCKYQQTFFFPSKAYLFPEHYILSCS